MILKFSAPEKQPARSRPPAELKAEKLFNWSNDQWATRWLPNVRIAAVQVSQSEKDFRQSIHKLMTQDDELLPNMLENLALLKEHLIGLVQLTDQALKRNFDELERLGYSPDNSPPGTVVS